MRSMSMKLPSDLLIFWPSAIQKLWAYTRAGSRTHSKPAQRRSASRSAGQIAAWNHRMSFAIRCVTPEAQ